MHHTNVSSAPNPVSLLPFARRALGVLLVAAMALVSACGNSGSSNAVAVTSGGLTTVTLTSIDVGPPDASVPRGLVDQFTATGLYSDGSRRDISALVTWSSSTATVASISNATAHVGLATTIAVGTTTITATMGSISGSTTLSVTAAVLEYIGITPAIPTIANGSRVQFSATGVFTDQSTEDVTASVTWSSATPTVATVGNATGTFGLATAVGPGTTLVTATLGGVTGSMSLTVSGATLVSIAITPTNRTLAPGSTQQFAATGVYSDNTTEDLTTVVTWTSSDATIATISNTSGSVGVAAALKAGSTTLTATFGGVSSSAGLTVSAATLVSIGVTPVGPTLPNGMSEQFIATGIYSDHSSQVITAMVTWSSSATAVASISNAATFQGLARGVGPGTTTITATLGTVAGSTTLTVTAATLVSLGVTPVNQSIAVGTSQQLMATGIYSDNTTKDLTALVTWSSSLAAVSISNAAGSNGRATGNAVGTAVITATYAGVAATTNLSVTAATLVSLAVTPATASIPKGTSQQFAATGTYSDGTTHDVTTSVSWSSSATTIAAVGAATGLAVSGGTGSSTGVTTLTATSPSGPTATAQLTVTTATLVSIAITAPGTALANGTSAAFTATGTYSDGSTSNLTASVTWSSSATTVATVTAQGGVVTAMSVGTATIEGTLGGVTGTANVTVTAATLVSIAVTPANPSVINGLTLQFTATGTYTDGSHQDLTLVATWKPVTGTVATLSNATGSNGLATAAAVGTLSVTATYPETGGVISPAVTLTVTPSEYAYVANFDPSVANSTVSQYTVGPGGSLIPMNPSTVAAGPTPFSLAADPSHHYVYAANFNQSTTAVVGSVSQYTVGTNGALTPMTPATVATGINPNGIAVDPLGRAVYVANFTSSNVSQYAIDPQNGSLTPMATATVAAGSGAATVTVNAAGTYAYVTNYAEGTVSQYSIDATTGALTPLTPARVADYNGSDPNFLVLDNAGNAYVANGAGGTAGDLSEYSIGTNGALSTTYSRIQTGVFPRSVAINPAGTALFVANGNSNTISQFALAGGALTPMTPPTIATPQPGPNSIAVEPSGAYVYVADRGVKGSTTLGNTVSQYSVAAGGQLAPLSTPTVPSGKAPAAIIVVPGYAN